ncbi:MAG: tRNA (cytidine(34)-2'-O)-methyltransferase [Oscillospiraceae bacterium]|nr:tRNA (cytidine(34)-2'-O)-methyltransferase [Oscillospiraceae bacterium]
MTLNIVMVEPQIPQNTGNIARTCSVTGAKLHLVGPMAFEIEDKHLKRAGLDYWHELDITYYKDIHEFFNAVTGGKLCSSSLDCTETEYPDTSDFEFYYFETHAPHIYTEPNYKDNSYLFFGSETIGLDEALLYKNPEQCVRFPMLHGARSMNLSSAVAVGVFEVLRQWGFPNLQNFGKMAETY